MGIAHLSADELSALIDGELRAQAELRARLHIGECVSCSAKYAEGMRLDEALREPLAVGCDEIVDLLSAAVDGEANQVDQALVRNHLAGCKSCERRSQAWASMAAEIRSLPRLTPSARVDLAIRDLVERPDARQTWRVRGTGVRAFIAVAAAAIVVAVGLMPGPELPVGYNTPGTTERTLVAGVQQIVLNPRNNTLYVLDPNGAAVDARDPGTNFIKTRIAVGGRPTALALNESANTILVLDAERKRVTEIDAVTNTVTSATTVAVTGTPTSISVGASATQILVGTTSSGQSNSTGGGALAVLDSSTKHLETVRETSIAPALVVPDQQTGRTALVSVQTTTLVDSSYNVVATVPGGVSATFSRQSDNLAVLSAAGADSVVTFAGTNAPSALSLRGEPRAITSLPDGGFLVLVTTGGGSRVSKITRDGTLAGSVDLAVPGGDLVYDGATNLFAVASGGRVDMAQIPTEVSSVATPRPTGSNPASPSPSGTPATSPSASPSPTAQPSASPAIALTSATTSLRGVAKARQLSADLYSYPLPAGVEPLIVATHGSRLWFVDSRNGIDVFDTKTSEYYGIGKLDGGARVSYLAAGSEYVFAVDTTSGQIDVVSSVQERVVLTYPMSALANVETVAVGPDDRLWLALRNAPYLLVFDPKLGRMDSLYLAGARVAALTVDAKGRVVYADDLRGAVGMFDPATNHLYEVAFHKRGTTTALVSDADATLWLGTTTGEIYAVAGTNVTLSVSLQRPVTTLVTDQRGRAWYLAPSRPGAGGFGFGPADGSQAARPVPGPAAGLAFNAVGWAFLGDPRGAVYIALPADER